MSSSEASEYLHISMLSPLTLLISSLFFLKSSRDLSVSSCSISVSPQQTLIPMERSRTTNPNSFLKSKELHQTKDLWFVYQQMWAIAHVPSIGEKSPHPRIGNLQLQHELVLGCL